MIDFVFVISDCVSFGFWLYKQQLLLYRRIAAINLTLRLYKNVPPVIKLCVLSEINLATVTSSNFSRMLIA